MSAQDMSTQDSTVWLIRHGESVANAGGAVTSFSEIPLTALGEEQAQMFADRFDELSPEPPTLIVRSPYLRARQTAEPLMARFPQVPVETWPVQEFTYLDPAATYGLNEAERAPFYASYWDQDSPDFANPGGAESFTHFMGRVRGSLSRFAALPAGARVAVFTHGYFMQGARLALLFPALSDQAMMSASRTLNDNEPIANTEILELRVIEGDIRTMGQEHITPLTLERVISHP